MGTLRARPCEVQKRQRGLSRAPTAPPTEEKRDPAQGMDEVARGPEGDHDTDDSVCTRAEERVWKWSALLIRSTFNTSWQYE